ncbi:sigma-54 interaction domain-containing protein [Salibacterium aidingense]|uniref:sigma-54 interaction domain-containing protein n=1 Tax=Salibacterium aidingense TaxID=384933 RepID=UPI00041898C6|nr:sigma-54-dependent Fis family transcriptional regulator [Salibacterium aidingense]
MTPEASLTAQEKQDIFRTIMNRLDEGVRIIDVEERLLLYNEKMRKIESMSYEDFDNKGMMEAFQFQDERDSRLLQAIKHGKSTRHQKQHYYNYRGKEIMTMNETFPIYSNNHIVAAAEIAKDITREVKLVRENQKKADSSLFTFQQIIGRSHKIKTVIEEARRATRTASSVLITGETGTGKELFAQSIHSESERANAPFISQNCAALPETLIEGILFGTVKGAFTGATDRAGLFEEAGGGTLLLDEINSLAPSLQAKLLRVLQEKKVTRIGDHKARPVNVRVITTMNEDPYKAMEEGRLREDLYYRLSVVSLLIPPLRERMTDVEPLTETFISKYNHRFQMQVDAVADDVLEGFNSYSWPGNIRELEHVIEGAMNLIIGENILQTAHLPSHFRNKIDSKANTPVSRTEKQPPKKLREQLLATEYELITQALTHTQGNLVQAARELGISRQSLQYRMKKLELGRFPFLDTP